MKGSMRSSGTAIALMLRAVLAALACAATPVHAADSKSGFDAFRFAKGRNVFDPDRRAMRTEAPPPRAPRRTSRPNFINLTGTIVSDGKALAFFSGSRSEYSKVVAVGQSIADFQVKTVTNKEVELERAGKQIVVSVGSAVPLEGSIAATSVSEETEAGPEEPAPSDGGRPPENRPPGSSPTPPPPSSTTSAPTSGGESDILRRMRERREKEMSK
jgi:hypothetical protein